LQISQLLYNNMLVFNKLLGSGLPFNLKRLIHNRATYLFGKRKREKDEMDETDRELFDDK
jgi:hypothetical protein